MRICTKNNKIYAALPDFKQIKQENINIKPGT